MYANYFFKVSSTGLIAPRGPIAQQKGPIAHVQGANGPEVANGPCGGDNGPKSRGLKALVPSLQNFDP